MSIVAGENDVDAAGFPICPACEQPIRTEDSFARVDRQILHLRCWIALPDTRRSMGR